MTMTKHLLYLLLLTAVLMGCTDKAEWETPYLNGETKTLVQVAALLDRSAPAVRATGKDFAQGDTLWAYLRHVTWEGGTAERNVVNVQNSPKLVRFIKGSGNNVAYSGDGDITPIGTGAALGLTPANTMQTSDLTAMPTLFWDDFSAGGKGDATHIATDNHYLQSYYGYCYNGGHRFASNFVEADGTLEWSIPSNQTEETDFRHADLLWSAEQTPVSYVHGASAGSSHGILMLPYTHAMSMVTVNVEAEAGFGNDALSATTVELQGMNRRCKTLAPTLKIAESTLGFDVGTVKMYKNASTFQAIVVPQTLLTEGHALLKISNVENNDYEVKVTSGLLEDGSWGKGLQGGKMQPGYNYVLNVSVSKAGVSVSATLKDWTVVEASGTGIIQFNPDITAKGSIDEQLKAGGLNIYKSNTQSFDTKSTTLTWADPDWNYDPAIYWAGQSDASYFRALSPTSATTAMRQGSDVLWGYACDADADKAKVGTANEIKLTPRTGDVPLHFEHIMSKLTVKLTTSKGADAVNLAGAVISVTNLYSEGTLDMKTGGISFEAASVKENPIQNFRPANYKEDDPSVLENYCVVPQTIPDTSLLLITLQDGTTYKLQLNTCQDGSSSPITAWQRGQHYKYTIHLTKEAITFRALVKAWDETTGNGNASLDWD